MISYLRSIEEKISLLDSQIKTIMEKLNDIQSQGIKSYKTLEDLEIRVKESKSIKEATIITLQGIADDLTLIKSDPEKIQELSNNLKIKAEKFAEAIVENTDIKI